ncbi:ATP-dependent zinc metalloprotease FtsH [bacterium]|nr:ATP-dependent zinc metalloprotease FtsH [bacterium]MBU1983546.1 ATP-dependent zinc metalloprotease FtsH [bacterium]
MANRPDLRPPNRKPSGPPGPRRFQFSIWYLVAVVLVLVIVQSFLTGESTTKLPYSEFKRMVADSTDIRLRKLAVTSEKISGEARFDSAGAVLWRKFETVRVEDPSLVQQLETRGVEFEGRRESGWWQSFLFAWILPFAVIFLIWSFLLRRMGGGGAGGVMSFGKSRAKVYAESATKVSFKDVAGIDEACEELKEVVEFLKMPGKFRALGANIPKGVLLVGPPGTGKTLLARAVAGEAQVPFFSISGSDFVEMFVGVGAARVRDLFQQAQQKAPCIVFIDELDALGKARGANPWGGHDEREQTLNALLVEMDGFESSKGVIIMAATNRPEILDIALLRPGRFDRQVVVDPPDIAGREAILKVHIRGKKVSSDVNLRVIAARTPGFVGADLANALNEAALLAARRGKKEIEMDELEEAVDREMTGIERRSRVLKPKVKEKIAYHECGHAIVGAKLTRMDPIHRVSIIPRGMSTLGHTLYLPTDDQYLISKEEILDRITATLGGRAAEELVFGEITSGAYNDLMQVTGMARAMVMDYGMSDKLGMLVYRRRSQPTRENPFPMVQEDVYSDATAEDIDEEIRRIVDGCYERARKILSENSDLLNSMSKKLLEVEVLEGDGLREFLGAERTTDFSQIARSAEESEEPAESPSPDDADSEDESSDETDSDSANLGTHLDRRG